MEQPLCGRLSYSIARELLCSIASNMIASASTMIATASSIRQSHAVDRAGELTEDRYSTRGRVLHSLASATILGASEASPISVLLVPSAAKDTEGSISAERSEAQPEASASELPSKRSAQAKPEKLTANHMSWQIILGGGNRMFEIYNVTVTYGSGDSSQGAAKSIKRAILIALPDESHLEQISGVDVRERFSGESYRLPDEKLRKLFN